MTTHSELTTTDTDKSFTVAVVEETTRDNDRLENIDDSLYDRSNSDNKRVEFEVDADDPLADALREGGYIASDDSE